MGKKFNVTGVCIPEKHYMVNIQNKLNDIMRMVEAGEYFTINRPRQYGKTTTLFMLEKRLEQEGYLVISTSFEGVGNLTFEKEERFCRDFLEMISEGIMLKDKKLSKYFLDQSETVESLKDLSKAISGLYLMVQKRIVLMIDEVDKNSNNELFLNFLGILRNKYLLREQKKDYTFHSVILAGVHDVKSLKLKIRSDEEQKYNSPWNIAVDFNVNMSFSPDEISTMLEDYGKYNNIKLDFKSISERLYYYTSGYPFLVSRLCKIIDEIYEKRRWEPEDVDIAVKDILQDKNTNFDSLIKNLENSRELYNTVSEIIMDGTEKTYNLNNPVIEMGHIYGIFRNHEGRIRIHNRIYEQLIYDYLSSKIETSTNMGIYNFRDNFIEPKGVMNFEKILLNFQEFLKQQYTERGQKFIEENGRLVFLAFLKPIINGKGFDFKEVHISEERRLDIAITYLDRKYVVELKIWRGQKAHEKGIKQLMDYLDKTNLSKGYLVIFDFRKTKQKDWKHEKINRESKEIFVVFV